MFYNDDDTPDFFLRVNIGEWNDYDYSYIVIMDGADGKALWAMNSSYATMQSAVTLMSVNHSQDAVVFFAYNPIDTKNLNATTVKKRKMDTDEESASLHNEKLSSNTSMPPNSSEDPATSSERDNDNYVDNIKHLGEQFWNLSNSSFPDPFVDPNDLLKAASLTLIK